AVTDQAGDGRIRVVDLGASFGGGSRAVSAWRPAGISGWGRPTNVRVQHHPTWGDAIVVPDSFGAVVIAGLDGDVRWTVDAGATANPHAAELLPDGVVVFAMSTGGRVASCPTGQGGRWDDIEVPGAHGVVWDGPREALWVLGETTLLELR